ncbi:MAG: ComEC/Rec2 family competence protein, partial [Pseudomonadota bacterium]
MRLYIMLFAIGAWLLHREAALPDMRYAGWLLLAAPVYAATRAHARAVKLPAHTLLAVTWLMAGFFWAAALAHVRMADALAPEWEGRDITLVGVVASLPQPFERSVRFEFDVEQILTPDAVVPQRIVLSWWGRGLSPTTERRDAASLPQVHPGERWRLTVRLKRPHGSLNPHGYDYEAALLERGVRATGYIRPGFPFERLEAVVHRPSYWIEIVRERLRTRILSALNDRPYAGVIAALVMGDQRAIPLAQWQTFTRTGVNHLMSISGLHVTMVSGLAWALAFGLWRRSARLTLMLPAAKAAALAGALTAFIYTLLAGFAVPAQRTLYMIWVVAIALWAGTGVSASVVLAAALMVVVLIDPWAVSS